MGMEQLLAIARARLNEMGMKPGEDHEIEDHFVILRVGAPNGKVVGSITMSPHWVGMTEEDATKVVHAAVLEAARAGMKQKSAHD